MTRVRATLRRTRRCTRMTRTLRTAAGLALAIAAIAAIAAPTAGAVTTIVTHSPDSLAPPNAPAHWLPPEAWVYNHWLPYDESRLYRLLGISRSQLWDQLRDDRHTVAQLAAARGRANPAKLAAALVAPRAGALSPQTLAILRDRAERTLTQGHLAQHVFFHSLHQFAIPSAAPELFGVTDAAFRALRRTELSPLAIGRLHGHGTGEAQARAIGVLRDRVDAGVREGSMTAAQGRLLLRRQLSQLPRWLDQQRYNGPPPTEHGALVNLPQDYASNPAISADGRYVAYESYRQKLPLAVQLGEIAVLRADLTTGVSELISPVLPATTSGFQPQSAYNPSISGDGARVVYETSAGNQNFAKRYGRIGVLLCDLHGSAAATSAVDDAPGGPALADSLSAYNPVLSGDGGSTAFERVRDGRTQIIARRGSTTSVAAAGLAASGASFRAPYEPGLSADGNRVVYTSGSGRWNAPAAASSAVLVRDLGGTRTILISRADGARGAKADGPASDGAISPDGGFVAFTARARNLGGPPGTLGLYLRDVHAGRTIAIPVPGGQPLDPVVARGGAAVAFTVNRGSRSQIAVWHAATGRTEFVSRATGARGALGDGRSADPSVSADGTRVAFASTAANLSGSPGSPPRGVYVRDLTAKTTRLVSDPSRAYPVAP